GVIMAVLVFVGMLVMMLLVVVMMAMVMVMNVRMAVFVVMIGRVMAEMDVEFCAFDLGAFGAGNMEVVAVQVHLFQFGFEMGKIEADVEERADEHVAADAAEKIEIECFHIFTA